jgi:hypothetical protein
MRSPMTLTMGFAVGLLVGFTMHSPRTAANAVSEAMDAATRDGAFLAKLDVESGRKPRLSIGRWSTNGDRALFIDGYQTGYQQAIAARSQGRPKADATECAAYRQGVADGAADLAASLPFRPEKTNRSYLKLADTSLQHDGNVEKFREEDRFAYLNGYEQGYYSQQKTTLWSYYAQ